MKKQFDFNKYYGYASIFLICASILGIINLVLKNRNLILVPLIAFVVMNFITMKVIKKNQDQIMERANNNQSPPYKKTFISYAISLVAAFALFIINAVAIQ